MFKMKNIHFPVFSNSTDFKWMLRTLIKGALNMPKYENLNMHRQLFETKLNILMLEYSRIDWNCTIKSPPKFSIYIGSEIKISKDCQIFKIRKIMKDKLVARLLFK